MDAFSISLEVDSILFFAEMVAIAHAGAVATQSLVRGRAGRGSSLFASALDESLPDQLRALLVVPLKSPDFRKAFREHFERHPNHAIRLVGWPWMREQLAWDA